MTLSYNIIANTKCVHSLLIDVQEKADMYKKISFVTIQELHAKEELIKKLESMKRDQKSGMNMSTFNTKFYYFQINFRRGRCKNIPFKGRHSGV